MTLLWRTATRPTRLKVFVILIPVITLSPQMFESKLPTTMGRAERSEKPDIGNFIRATHPGRCPNSRYQVHAEGDSGPD